MVSVAVPSWMQYNPFATSFAQPISGVFAQGAKTPWWGVQIAKKVPKPSILSKVPIPSIKTTAKVGAVGTIGYTAYKGSESLGRFFETGTFTKKEAVMSGETILPVGFGAGEQPIINILPQKESFWGELGAGAGQGLGGLGIGAGSGLGIALPVVAVGAIILLAMKEKKK